MTIDVGAAIIAFVVFVVVLGIVVVAWAAFSGDEEPPSPE